MAITTPIIDVWTQYLSPTPPGTNPAGENVFRNYGMLDVYHQGTDPKKMIDLMDQHGVKIALIPKDNEKDLVDIPENVKMGLEIVPVATVDEVLQRALVRPLTPIEWSEEDELAETRRAEGGGSGQEGARPH